MFVVEAFVAVSVLNVLFQEKAELPPLKVAGDPLVVLQNGTWPEVSADDVPTFILNFVQSEEEMQPVAEPLAAVQVTVSPEPIMN